MSKEETRFKMELTLGEFLEKIIQGANASANTDKEVDIKDYSTINEDTTLDTSSQMD